MVHQDAPHKSLSQVDQWMCSLWCHLGHLCVFPRGVGIITCTAIAQPPRETRSASKLPALRHVHCAWLWQPLWHPTRGASASDAVALLLTTTSSLFLATAFAAAAAYPSTESGNPEPGRFWHARRRRPAAARARGWPGTGRRRDRARRPVGQPAAACGWGLPPGRRREADVPARRRSQARRRL